MVRELILLVYRSPPVGADVHLTTDGSRLSRNTLGSGLEPELGLLTSVTRKCGDTGD